MCMFTTLEVWCQTSRIGANLLAAIYIGVWYTVPMPKIGGNKTTWDLSYLLKGDNDPSISEKLKEVEEKNYAFINKWRNRRDYLVDSRILKKALDEYEELCANYGTSGSVGYYFWLRSAQEEGNPEIKAKCNKIGDLIIKLSNDIMFFTHNISKIPQNKQEKFVSCNELKDYKHFLELLFDEAQYLLTEPEEKIMNLESRTSYGNWVKMTWEFLSKEEREVLDKNGKKVKKTFSEIWSLLSDKNKKVRDTASKVFNEILEKHVDVAEAEINSILDNKKVNDELRKMPRPDTYRHISDDIDTEIVDVLVDVVGKNFEISRRYYELKAKLLGVEKLEYHERNVEYGKISDRYPYGKSVEIVEKVFKNLDKKFFDIFKDFVENGNIDVFPRKGKGGSAFCQYWLKTHPVYIFLNHGDRFDDVKTLAHEMGHAINNELMRKQNSLNFGTPLSTAEVASTFVEDFVVDEISKNANEEIKLAIMMARLDDCVGSIFRQIACYKFEQELHKSFREKGYLSKKEIGELFQKHMRAYMGEFVELSSGSQNWWVQWSHIRDFFYVYSYASGLLISKSLQGFVKKDPKFIEKVKEFLGAGESRSPKEIFLDLGIDITDKKFWDKGLKEIGMLLKETEKLAKKLKKI